MIRVRSSRAAASLLLVLASAACTVQPISKKVVPGETIIFPIAWDDKMFTVGYSSTELGWTDWQFGTLVFELDHAAAGCDRTVLPRWVTRAWPDPASLAGAFNALPTPTQELTSQVLVALDIPANACPGTYSWSIRNDVPGTPTNDIEGELFRHAPGHPPALNSFEVLNLPAPTPNNRSNPFEGYLGSATYDIELGMLWLIPHHKFAWDMVANPLPAAAEIVFEYPAAKISPLNVFEDNHLGRHSIVRWCIAGVNECAADTNPSDSIGELHVRFADPDTQVSRLAVAFKLMDDYAPSPPVHGPLWVDDVPPSPTATVKVKSKRFYDGWGNETTAAVQLTFVGVW